MMPGRPIVWLRYQSSAGDPPYRVEWSENDSQRWRLFHEYRNALLFARRKGTVNNDVPMSYRRSLTARP